MLLLSLSLSSSSPLFVSRPMLLQILAVGVAAAILVDAVAVSVAAVVAAAAALDAVGV